MIDKFSALDEIGVQSLSLDSNAPLTQSGVIYALYHNCFFAISPLQGQIVSQLCPNIEIPSSLVTPVITNKDFRLSHVISHPEPVPYNKPYPILSGSLEASSGKEKLDFVLSISIGNRAVSLVEIATLPTEKHDVNTKSRIGYQPAKFFSYFFDPESLKFTVITLSNPPTTFMLDLSAKFSRSENIRYEVSLHTSVFETSVVQICQKSDLMFSTASQSCVFLSIEKGADNSFIAREIHSFQGQIYTSIEADYSKSKSGVIKNILCLSMSSAASDIHLTLITLHPSGQHLVTHSTFSRAILPGPLSTFSHLSFSTYLSKTTSDAVVKLLIQDSAGTLALIQQGRGVRWTREESLSRVRQGVILDNPATLENKGLTSIPAFEKRLQLQIEDLKSKLTSFQTSIQSIPETVSTLVHDSLPPNLATSLMPNFKASKKAVDFNVELFGFNKISVQLTSR